MDLKSTSRATAPRRAPSATKPHSPTGGGGASTICIVVADGAAIDRSAISALLRAERDFLVVGQASNSTEAIEVCRKLEPDVLLMTNTLPSPNGELAIREVRTALPDLGVVAMSERGWSDCLVLNPPSPVRPRTDAGQKLCAGGSDCLQVAAAHGAMGTVRRSADPAALFATLRSVAAGRASYEPGTIQALTSTQGDGRTELSPRMLEVAQLLAEGHSNKEIASALGISEPTVKKHVAQILHRLGFEDRLQAALFVARHPLLFTPRTPERA
jgi:DNA-binding NarL/FixJ family response regulator